MKGGCNGGKDPKKGSNRKAKALRKIKNRMKKAQRRAFKNGLDPRSAKLKGRANCGEYVTTLRGVVVFD